MRRKIPFSILGILLTIISSLLVLIGCNNEIEDREEQIEIQELIGTWVSNDDYFDIDHLYLREDGYGIYEFGNFGLNQTRKKVLFSWTYDKNNSYVTINMYEHCTDLDGGKVHRSPEGLLTIDYLGANYTKYSSEVPSFNNLNEGSTISDSQIRNLIDKCVSVAAKYEDYTWYFTIESTLHNELTNCTIKFGIGHGDINGTEQVSVEEQAYKYNSQIIGKKKTMFFTNPFWFYYVFGLDPSDKENWTRSQMYLASYCAMKEKGYSNLIQEEKEFFNKLTDTLNNLEQPATRNYHPSVQVLIDSKFYIIKRFQLK